MINWLIVADVALGVLKDVAIATIGGLLLTALVLYIEGLIERWE